jgi:death-on-curing protein
MEFNLPNEEVVLKIHELALSIGGGLEGILHPERIPAALSRPQTFIDFRDDCDIHLVCAVLLHSLATSHPFTEGNKRTALLTTIMCYQVNGVELHMSLLMNDAYKDLVLWVVEQKPTIDEIALKLKDLVEAFEPSLIDSLMDKLRNVIINRNHE